MQNVHHELLQLVIQVRSPVAVVIVTRQIVIILVITQNVPRMDNVYNVYLIMIVPQDNLPTAI